jgi:hypothetical protein
VARPLAQAGRRSPWRSAMRRAAGRPPRAVGGRTDPSLPEPRSSRRFELIVATALLSGMAGGAPRRFCSEPPCTSSCPRPSRWRWVCHSARPRTPPPTYTALRQEMDAMRAAYEARMQALEARLLRSAEAALAAPGAGRAGCRRCTGRPRHRRRRLLRPLVPPRLRASRRQVPAPVLTAPSETAPATRCLARHRPRRPPQRPAASILRCR